jgi:hypothetical protein
MQVYSLPFTVFKAVAAKALTPAIRLITSPKINILGTPDNQRLFVGENK